MISHRRCNDQFQECLPSFPWQYQEINLHILWIFSEHQIEVELRENSNQGLSIVRSRSRYLNLPEVGVSLFHMTEVFFIALPGIV